MADIIIRPNQPVQILSTAARTTEQTVSYQLAEGCNGIILFIDVTVDAASGSITPSIDSADPGGDNDMEPVTAFSAIAAVGHFIKVIALGAVETAAVTPLEVQGIPAPSRGQFKMAVADTDSLTYGVRAYGVPS